MGTVMPNPNDDRILGWDTSQHNGFTNFDVFDAALPRIHYGATRTGISWGYQDKLFSHNWIGMKAKARLRAGYHVLYPKQPAQDQVDNMMRIVGNDPGEGPPVWDVELKHNTTRSQLTAAVENIIIVTERSWGRRPCIYTSPFFMRDNMLATADWYNDVVWWMANYLLSGQEATDNHLKLTMANTVPSIDIENVWIHQTTQRGKASHYGAKSADIDFDRWRGTQEQYNEFWQLGAPPIPPGPGPGPDPVPVTVSYKAGDAEILVVET